MQTSEEGCNFGETGHPADLGHHPCWPQKSNAEFVSIQSHRLQECLVPRRGPTPTTCQNVEVGTDCPIVSFFFGGNMIIKDIGMLSTDSCRRTSETRCAGGKTMFPPASWPRSHWDSTCVLKSGSSCQARFQTSTAILNQADTESVSSHPHNIQSTYNGYMYTVQNS